MSHFLRTQDCRISYPIYSAFTYAKIADDGFVNVTVVGIAGIIACEEIFFVAKVKSSFALIFAAIGVLVKRR